MLVYVITDGGKNFIRRDVTGRYVPIGNRVLADEFEERHKAQRVLDCNLSPKLRKKYKIKAENLDIKKQKTDEPKTSDKIIQDLDNIKKSVGQPVESKLDEFAKNLQSVQSFILDVEERKKELSDELSKIDKELNDVNHYIEMTNFDNEKDKCSAFDMLQNMMQSRRKIKNELRVLKQLGDCKVDSSMVGDILIAINELDNRKYIPRVLTELFE